MTNPDDSSLGSLGRQSLRRPLTPAESGLARALETVFATGQHEFAAVVEYLQQQRIARPSGSTDPWTVAALEEELRKINVALDEAYVNPAGVAK